MENGNHQCSEHHGHQRARYFFHIGQFGCQNHQRQTAERQRAGSQTGIRELLDQVPQLFMEMFAGHAGQAEEIFPLTDPDDDTDPAGEADNYRRRDEFDDAAETAETHQHQDNTGHQGGDLQPADTEFGGDPGQNDDESAGWPGNL